MSMLLNFLNFINSADNFTKVILIILLILYNLYALVLAFQIFSFNRVMVQKPFAPVFQFVAILHIAISFILLLLVVFSL